MSNADVLYAPSGLLMPPPGLPLPPQNDGMLPVKESTPVLDPVVATSYPSLPDCFAGKSPLSVLREECIKKGLEPVYELVESDGPVHNKLFTYRVTAGERTAVASGSSKKKARHACASIIIGEMFTNGFFQTTSDPPDRSTESNDALTTVPSSSPPDENVSNPVGKLQELTQRRYIAPPIYEITDNGLKPHERVYTCIVQLAHFAATGIARTKKLAKRTAAEALLGQINADADRLDQLIPTGVVRQRISAVHSSYSALAAACKPSNNEADHTPEKLLGNSAALLDCPIVSCSETLQQVADAGKFEVTYVDIPEIASTGHCQCLVQLSTMPVITCRGIGYSKEEARSSAALSALRSIAIASCTTLLR